MIDAAAEPERRHQRCRADDILHSWAESRAAPVTAGRAMRAIISVREPRQPQILTSCLRWKVTPAGTAHCLQRRLPTGLELPAGAE